MTHHRSPIKRRSFVQQTAWGLMLSPLMGFDWRPPGASWLPSEATMEAIPGLLKVHGLSALSTAVVENGNVWQRTWHDTSEPSGPPDPVFEAGSLSKPIAAVVALQLQNKGLLALDRPLMEYLPLPDLVGVSNAYKITARNVLSHSSGLQNWRFQTKVKLALQFPPGTGYNYSGEGYVWLQRIFEQLTGQGYAGYVKRNLFEDLGMTTSSFIYDSDIYHKLIPGHKQDGSLGDAYGERIGSGMLKIAQEEGTNLLDWDFNKATSVYPKIERNLPPLPVFLTPNAAGSLVATVRDYALFLKALLQNDYQPLGLKKNDHKELFKPISNVASNLNWGLGWGLDTSADKTAFHTAETRFYKGAALLGLKNKQGILVLTNGANGDRVYDQVLRASTGLKLPALDQF